MSTEAIFGGWGTPPAGGINDLISNLWHQTAAQGVGTSAFQPNSGLSQRRHEITMLWSLFYRMQPKIVVEVGVAQGGTFAGWCKLASHDATLIAIDRCLDDARPRPGDPVHPAIYSGPLASTSNGGGIYHLRQFGQRIIGINGWSYEPHVMEKLLAELDGRKIDFLFNDASHSASMFAQDFKLYWPLVADGGIFATHDIMKSAHPDCDKNTEWERIKREEEYSACYEFLGSRHDDSMGIGVLIK